MDEAARMGDGKMRGLWLAGLFFIWHSTSFVRCEEAPEPGKDIVTRQAVFSIPFTGSDLTVNAPKEVQLYVSSDRGRRWSLYQRQHPSTGQFRFR